MYSFYKDIIFQKYTELKMDCLLLMLWPLRIHYCKKKDNGACPRWK